MPYKAFISYSHSADAKLAPALRSALRRIGSPWYRRAQFRIFLDNSSLSANPALWSAIESALGQSEYLLLLASSKSAQSEWVNKEVDWWLSHRGIDHLLILVTDGEVSWRTGDNDFDWKETTALSGHLRGQFKDEPLWVDLRWARTEGKLSLRDSRFRGAVLEVAPPLYGKARDDLDDEDTRRYKSARRLASVGLLVLALLVAGIWLTFRDAGKQRSVADCRELAGHVISLIDTRLDLALLLGVENSRQSSCVEGRSALLTALERRPHLEAFLSGHTDTVTDLAFTRDGKLLASSSWDKTIRLWDIEKRKATGPLLKGMYGLSFSPDGTLLASADGETIKLWKIPDGTPAGELPVKTGSEMSRVSFSPDGRLIAASNEATGVEASQVSVWNVATRQLLGPTIPARAFAFSPKGKVLATEGEDGKSIVFWDIKTRRQVGPPMIGPTARLRCIAFSADGDLVAVGSEDNAVTAWEVQDKKSPGTRLMGHHAAVNAVEFSPDGKTLASGSGDGSIILWNLEKLQPVGSPLSVGDKPVFSIAFTPDGRRIVSTSEARVVVWNIAEDLPVNRDLPTPDQTEAGPVFSPDGKILATMDTYGQVNLSDVETGKVMLDPIGDRVTGVAFSPDGKLMATAAWDGTFAFWNPATGDPVGDPLKTDFRLWSVRFSPDGRTVSVGGDAVFLLWNVKNRRWVAQNVDKQKDRIWSVPFSPDGKLVASGGNKSFAVWNATTGSPLTNPTVTDAGQWEVITGDVAFSHDGKLLAYRAGDKGVVLWDVAHKRPIGNALSGHKGLVTSLAFTANDRVIATGGEDGNVILWDLATRQAIGSPLTGMGDKILGLAFRPGSSELAALGDKRLLIWNLNEEDWRKAACRIANRDLTNEEWRKFFGTASRP